MKKSIILVAFLMLSISGFSQGGLYKPSYIAWPEDTTEFGVLVMDTVTKKGAWFILNPTDFDLEGGVVGLRVQSDSVFVMGDSLCAITNGDTLCVYQDSTFITSDSFCVIQNGDTTCVSFSGGFGPTLYTGNDTIQEDRSAYLLSTKFLRFIRIGSPNTTLLQLERESAQNNVTIKNNNATSNKPVLSLANDHATSNNFIEFENSGDIGYGFGVERTTWDDLVIFETNDIQTIGTHYLRFSGNGDSTIVGRDIQFDAGVLDSDGDYGTSGQVLSSTGTLTNWINAAGDSLPISKLKPALSARNLDNLNFEQEWKWGTLAGGSGLKLSSSNTLAVGNTQKLFEVSLTGINGVSAQQTYAGHFTNSHSGTISVNYGLRSSATGGTTNYGIYSSSSGGTTNYGGYFDGTNFGAYGTSVAGQGVTGVSTSGYGGRFTTTSGNAAMYATNNGGTAIWGESVGGQAAFLTRTDAGTNSSAVLLRIQKFSTGTAANGLGGSIDYYIQTSSGVGSISNEIKSIWTDATAATRTSQLSIRGINSAVNGDIIYFEGDRRTRFNGRAEMQQGADIASVAGAITLGYDGNVFEITGTNAIILISNLGWQNGSEITLFFTSTASLTDGTANSGTDIGMELNGNVNFTGSAEDSITLMLSEIGGTQRWREKSRSIN